MSQKIFLMISTASSKREAEKIARVLIHKKLAACVNILDGAVSLFRWKGKLEKAREAVLLIKTTRKRSKAVEAAIKKAHSYENPEVIGFDIREGSREYLKWVLSSVKN